METTNDKCCEKCKPKGDERKKYICYDKFCPCHQLLLEAREKNKELAEALLDMYEQYCGDGHDFMTAGEHASTVLEMQGYASFDEAGRMLTRTNETKGMKRLCQHCLIEFINKEFLKHTERGALYDTDARTGMTTTRPCLRCKADTIHELTVDKQYLRCPACSRLSWAVTKHVA